LVLDGRELIRQAYFGLIDDADTDSARSRLISAAEAFKTAAVSPNLSGYAGAKEGAAWATMWLGVTQVLLGDPQGVGTIEKAHELSKSARSSELRLCHRRSATERAAAAQLLNLDDADAWWDAAADAAESSGDGYASLLIANARRRRPGSLEARVLMRSPKDAGAGEAPCLLGSRGGYRLHTAMA
jgi:hypothetical protein